MDAAGRRLHLGGADPTPTFAPQVPLRILLYLWAFLVGVSRVLLGKHHLSDVGCGFALGFLLFSLVESVWLDSAACQVLLAVGSLHWAPLV